MQKVFIFPITADSGSLRLLPRTCHLRNWPITDRKILARSKTEKSLYGSPPNLTTASRHTKSRN